MTLYRAYIDPQPTIPGKPGPVLEAKSLKGLKAQFERLNLSWPDLEWPRTVKQGHYFHARDKTAGIEIYRVAA